MHAPPVSEAEIESHVRNLVATVGYENLTYRQVRDELREDLDALQGSDYESVWLKALLVRLMEEQQAKEQVRPRTRSCPPTPAHQPQAAPRTEASLAMGAAGNSAPDGSGGASERRGDREDAFDARMEPRIDACLLSVQRVREARALTSSS